jgi:hypothetical protein
MRIVDIGTSKERVPWNSDSRLCRLYRRGCPLCNMRRPNRNSSRDIRRFNVATFEIIDDPSEDILSSVGFIKAVRLMLQVRGRGILHFATVCSSWVMINRSTSGRSPYWPLGDTSHQYVRDANTMVSRTVLLALFGLALGFDWALEQPSSSLMFFHPRPGHPKSPSVAHARLRHLHCELLISALGRS